MLYARQKLLLSLLGALGGSAEILDFQKLLFLFCQEEKQKAPYDFVPCRYGGFSLTSYADRRRLIERGLLEKDDNFWKLTQAGRRAASAGSSRKRDLSAFARRHAQLRGDGLIAGTYRRFPYFAIRSEIADSLLCKEPQSLVAIAAARPRPAGAGICTIGYEGRSLEGYLNRLIDAGVTLLCDVRRNPLSRKYGFSKATLASACEGVGIRYEHLPELGIASEERRGLNGQAAYNKLFETYRSETLPQHGRALAMIRQWVEDGQRVALTCFEQHPQQCHRHCVADALQQRFGESFAATHV